MAGFRSTAVRAISVVALCAPLGGCGLGGPAYSGSVAAQVDQVVEMTTTLDFAPAETTITAGDTVEWRNVSIMSHTVTAVPGAARDPAHVALPPDAEPFDSGGVPPGEIYRHRFTVPGTYRYFCRPHEANGMVGVIQVRPSP